MFYKRFRRTVATKRASRQFRRLRSKTTDEFMVCGTVDETGRPLYFRMPVGSSDELIAEKAFEIRNGRPMSPLEREFAQMIRPTDG